MIQEIELRKDYLVDKELSSIYFGGGTPSLLSEEDLERIFEAIYRHFSIKKDAEITLEANPDDLNTEKLQILRKTPINRLSIGIQSFFEEDLRWMNRAHTAEEADGSIKRAQDFGFEDLTIDLIYGSPTTTMAMWQSNLQKTKALEITHLSCYCLTVEAKTALAHFVQHGKTEAPKEKVGTAQFLELMDWAEREAWLHYEISNFARLGHEAKHNSHYWDAVPYLGIGPSAHSYDGTSRQWNIANNGLYMKALADCRLDFEREALSEKDRFNEYVMTGLRLSKGCRLERLAAFGQDYVQHFQVQAAPYIESGLMEKIEHAYVLSRSGKLRADGVASDLFIV